MKPTVIATALLLTLSTPALAAPTEQPGTYKEAVLCSGLLSATTAMLIDDAEKSGKADDKEQAEYSADLQKRWIDKAIDLSPDALAVMGDVNASAKHYSSLFIELKDKSEADYDRLLGADMSNCLDAGAKLPPNK